MILLVPFLLTTVKSYGDETTQGTTLQRLVKINTNLEPSCFLPFFSLTIITESLSWAERKEKVVIAKRKKYRSKLIFNLLWTSHIKMPCLKCSNGTWWLCVLRGVILQSRWRGRWWESGCSAGTGVHVRRPCLDPWPAGGPTWAREVAGTVAWRPPGAGGIARTLWSFPRCWQARGSELLHSAAGHEETGTDEKVTGIRRRYHPEHRSEV